MNNTIKTETKTELKDITPDIVKAVLQKGLDFTVHVQDVIPIKVNRWRQFWEERGILEVQEPETKRKFIIKPIKLAPLMKISEEISTMTDFEIGGNKDLFKLASKCVENNLDSILRILCYAVNNNDSEPSNDLIRFFEINLSVPELTEVFIQVIRQTGTMDFLSLTVLIKKRMNLIKAQIPKETLTAN